MTVSIFKKIQYYVLSGRSFLLDVFFPVECLFCNKPGKWVCDSCFRKIEIKQSQNCPICRRNNLSGSFCRKCKGNLHLDGVLVSSDYSNKYLSILIKSYKYKLLKDLSTPLASLAIKLISQILKEGAKNYYWNKGDNIILKKFSKNIVIPVPLFWKRKNWRGFNQSEEISKIFAKHFNLPINTKDLQRIKFKKTQTKLNKDERFKNIKNNFLWTGENLMNKNIILIDDVSTSMATLNECSIILKKAGANRVWGLVIGHRQ